MGTPSHHPRLLPVFLTYTRMQQQGAYCHPGTLKTLSKSKVLMFCFFQTGWTAKNGVREEQRMKEGTQNHVRAPQGGLCRHCEIQSCAPHPA